LRIIRYSAAYILPAALLWGVVAVAIYPLTLVSHTIAILAGMYAVVFGLLEAAGIPFRSLGSAWQIPAQWLKRRSVMTQTLIWGVTLGPGFLTRNPYAGMWLILLLLPLQHSFPALVLAGGIVGATHGASRVAGIIYNHRHLDNVALLTVLAQARWRIADGMMLLFIAGGLIAIFY
jgi:hypothetical protein